MTVSFLYHSLDLEWRAIYRNLIKLACGQMTGEYGLNNDIGGFGIADYAQD